MSMLVLNKLLAIFCTVAIGWLAGRLRWLGPPPAAAAVAEGAAAPPGTDPARLLGHAAFYIFVPALLFRTTARLDPASLPWATLLAFFVPVLALMLAVHGLRRWQLARRPWPWSDAPGALDRVERQAAEPAARAVAVVFGNSVQVGIPLAVGVYGEAGLGIHIALVSLHALVLLTSLTVLAELDIARARAVHDASAGLWRTLRTTVRNTVIHPVVLPVLAGLAWHATGWPLPGPLDETLALLGTAVAPLCLVLIGLTLAYTEARHLGPALRSAAEITLCKLVLMPALVLAVAHGVFGLRGVPLAIVVMMAALPTGANALIFAQRYRSHEAEATAAIVLSTLLFALSAPLWLALLASPRLQ